MICDSCRRNVEYVRASFWHGDARICRECFAQWCNPDDEQIGITEPSSIGNYVRLKHGLPPIAAALAIATLALASTAHASRHCLDQAEAGRTWPTQLFVLSQNGLVPKPLQVRVAARAAFCEVNNVSKIAGGAKKLARLAKAWKYYNEVPVSSFYLEMRAAEYISGEETHIPIWDICGLLQRLDQLALAPMKDPKTTAGQFDACATSAEHDEAVSKLRRGANRARKALEAFHREDMPEVFYYLDLLFGGNFPSRY